MDLSKAIDNRVTSYFMGYLGYICNQIDDDFPEIRTSTGTQCIAFSCEGQVFYLTVVKFVQTKFGPVINN
jgi:hypothetical protein